MEPLTDVIDPEKRSTAHYWINRVARCGIQEATFLTHSPAQVANFTRRHLQIIGQYATNKDVLEIGCGWGRMAPAIDSVAHSYIGVDFVPASIDMANENNPELRFFVQDARQMTFENGSFDVVVAIATLSSLAFSFDELRTELRRVLRPNGIILFLEEDFARVDWKA